MSRFCNDYADPGVIDCAKDADPQYTMDFTMAEPGAYIYWCKVCGPRAHMFSVLMDKALDEGGPEFASELTTFIEEAKSNKVLH